jgi:hypothetical protein
MPMTEDLNLLLDDEIIQEKEELWQKLSIFADNVSNQLSRIPPRSPVLLSGDWGSGKSSVLKAIESNLTYNNINRCVWFDAWLYEQEESLLPSLIRKVWEKTKGESEDTFFDFAMKISQVLAARALPVAAHLLGFGEKVEKALSGLSTDKLLKEFAAASSGFKPEQNLVDALTCSFHEMVYGSIGKQPLYILIDDLDRCSPDSAISLLDNLRQLLNNLNGRPKGDRSANIRFIVAMDKTTLTDSVANKFKGINSYEGNRYLEKLFPFVYTVPTLEVGELNQFINRLFKKLQGDEFANPNNIEERELIIESLSDPSFHNPRLLKRCINRFFQMYDFDQDLQDTPTLLLWIAASERWPLLRRLMQRKNYTYWRMISEAVLSGGEVNDTEAEELLTQKGFKDFYRKHFAEKLELSFNKFNEAERKLANHGL